MELCRLIDWLSLGMSESLVMVFGGGSLRGARFFKRKSYKTSWYRFKIISHHIVGLKKQTQIHPDLIKSRKKMRSLLFLLAAVADARQEISIASEYSFILI